MIKGGGMAEHISERACTTRVEFVESLGDGSYSKGAKVMIPSIYYPTLLVMRAVLPLVVVFG